MREEVFWYSQRAARSSPPLDESVEADAVVVGGRIAGLSAAQWLCEEAGKNVVLLESRFCGAGARGKSSGFVTPDSKIDLDQPARRFGDDDAALLWRASQSGCEQIRRNIGRFPIDCDFVEADSLYVANGKCAFSSIKSEHEAHERLGFQSQLYTEESMPEVLGSDGYNGGVRYNGTFGINGFAYVQGLKDALIKQGVRVFEGSPVVEIKKGGARTLRGGVQAKHIFICMDKYAPDLQITEGDNYHAQTFIVLSEPLDESILQAMFPDKAMLVWDTDLVYQYYRRTGDNRLLVGGGLLRETYQPHKSHHSRAIEHLISYIRRKFPVLGKALPIAGPG